MHITKTSFAIYCTKPYFNDFYTRTQLASPSKSNVLIKSKVQLNSGSCPTLSSTTV